MSAPNVYRLTYVVARAHYGHYNVGGKVTKIKSRRAMLASVESDRQGANLKLVKIEEAPILLFEDVTSQYLPSEGAESEDPAQGGT